MSNKDNKLALATVVIFEVIVISAAVTDIASKQWKSLIPTFLTAVFLILPFITTRVANRKSIMLPSSFQLIMLVFVFLAQYLGEIKRFYLKLWWWDLLLHAIFGSYAVIIALHSIKGIIKKNVEISKQRFIAFKKIFSFAFSIALGALWELFEFIADYFFNTDMIKGGIEDTATDLLVISLSAFITAEIYYYQNSKKAM